MGSAGGCGVYLYAGDISILNVERKGVGNYRIYLDMNNYDYVLILTGGYVNDSSRNPTKVTLEEQNTTFFEVKCSYGTTLKDSVFWVTILTY